MQNIRIILSEKFLRRNFLYRRVFVIICGFAVCIWHTGPFLAFNFSYENKTAFRNDHILLEDGKLLVILLC